MVASGNAAFAQNAVVCAANAGVPPLVRDTGRSELVGDIVLICTGGVANAAVNATITLFLNTNITSRVSSGQSTDALAFIDEPAPAAQVMGTNVFSGQRRFTQGGVVAQNALDFVVSFAAPGPNVNRVIRLSNIRANAAGIGASSNPGVLSQIVAFVSIVSGGTLAIDNPQQVVAYIQKGVTISLRDAPGSNTITTIPLQQCIAQNPALAVSNAATGTPNFHVRFSEGFISAFAVRESMTTDSIVGTFDNSETGFFNPGLGTNLGRATNGTRLMARFTNVPPGITLYVTTTSVPSLSTTSAIAALTAADENGAGAFAAQPATSNVTIGGTNVGIRPLSAVNGTATAVWEVTGANRVQMDDLTFAVLVAYQADIPPVSALQVVAGLAPSSNVDTVSLTEPVPRFTSLTAANGSISIAACAPAVDLSVSSFTTATSIKRGTSPPFAARIKNTGSTTAPATKAKLQMRTLGAGAGVDLLTCNIPALPIEASEACGANLVIPADTTPGPYNLVMIADSDNMVLETNESNNTSALMVTIHDCSYTLLASAPNVTAAGGSGVVTVTTTAGCTWTPVAPPFITLSGITPGNGSGSFAYTVAPNSGAARVGTIAAAGVGVDISQAAYGPGVISLEPTVGAGTSGTFTATFSHPGGALQHYLGYILLLPTPNVVQFTATGSCLIEYNRISNGMRLIDNAGTGWLGGESGILVGPGGSVLTNTQCSVNTALASASLSGTAMTVTVPVTFRAGASGVLGTFLQGFDVTGKHTGMTQFGNWLAFAPTSQKPGPFIQGLHPPSGSGTSGTFTVTAGHTGGAGALSMIHVLIADRIVGGSPCQIVYFPGSNSVVLINDTGTDLVTGNLTPGLGTGTLSNSRCTVSGSGMSRAVGGNFVSVTFPLSFSAATFAGAKNVYTNAFDNAGLLTHWVQGGVWTVQ